MEEQEEEGKDEKEETRSRLEKGKREYDRITNERKGEGRKLNM